MAQVIGEEIANGGTNLIGITKNIEEMLNELPPSLKLDLGSFKISSAGFDLFSEQRKINEKTHEIEVEKSTPTYTKVREEFGDRHKYIAQAQETAKKMFVYDSEPYKADPNSIQVKHAQLRDEHEHSKNEDRER